MTTTISTFKHAVAVIKDEVQFEQLTSEQLSQISDILTKSNDVTAPKHIEKFTKLLKARKEIAPKEEVQEIVAIENSIKAPEKKEPKKFVPKKQAQKNAEEKAKAVEDAQQQALALEEPTGESTTPDAFDEEDEIHGSLEDAIDGCKNMTELKKLAAEYNVKIPAKMKIADARKFFKEQSIGGTTPEEEEVVEEVEFQFPEEHGGRTRVELKDLDKVVVEKPYNVYAFILEDVNSAPTVCLVTYSNENVVVLVDKSVQVDSVIPLARKSFIEEGTKVIVDNIPCPVAFYA